MEEIFKTIAPYSQSQIEETLVWLESSVEFIKGVQYFYPKWTKEKVIKKLKACNTCADFQVTFIEMIIKNSINNTMDSFEIIGLDKIDTTNSLFISNHRDIFLDSALLQNHLYDIGRPFTEISLGDNLMVNDTMKAVAKLNNMFTVFRGGKRMEQLKNSVNLSKYIRHSITDKKVSSWIAQGNGRTKDGNDVTATGLIKMLLLSGGADIKNSLAELNIVVSTISFEYEPCAFEKAHELSLLDEEGTYHKKEFENISSILKGIHDHKGQVKLVFEKLNVDNIEFTNNRKKDVIKITEEIDKIVYKNFQLWKTNYMAYDLLLNDYKYQKYYNREDVVNFKNYLKRSDNEDIYYRLLKMYTNPIYNKNKFL